MIKSGKGGNIGGGRETCGGNVGERACGMKGIRKE